MVTALRYYDRLSPAVKWLDGINLGVLGAAAPWCRRLADDASGEGRHYNYAPANPTVLLLENVPFKCTDPRDKVYALLGLTSWSIRRKTFPAEFEPDYTLSTGECMRRATLAAICEERSLECLTLSVWTKREPSWVVPWHELEVDRNRHPHVESSFHFAMYHRLTDWSGGRNVNLDILRQPDKPDSLFLEGFAFFKIWQVSDIVGSQDVEGFPFKMKLQEMIRSVKVLLADEHLSDKFCQFVMRAVWWNVVMSKDGDYWTGVLAKDNMLQSSGEPVEALDAPDKQAKHDHCKVELLKLQRLIKRLGAESHATHDNDIPLAASPEKWSEGITERLDWSISNSRFYLTILEPKSDPRCTGYLLGYGPIDMSLGDQIVVLCGSRLPIVLRPEQSWWLWIGPTFHMTVLETKSGASVSAGSTEVFEIR